MQATTEASDLLGYKGEIDRVFIKPTSKNPTGWAAIETYSGDFVVALVGKKELLLDALATLGISEKGLLLVRMKFTEAKPKK